MSALTLPGAIPGLLRAYSPVVTTKATHTFIPKGKRGVAVGLARRAVWQVALLTETPSGRTVGRCAAAQQSALSLDLTDATGRAHAAWWLAPKLRPEVTERMGAAVTYGHADIGSPGYGLAVTCRLDGALWRRVDDVPGLDALDPNDPRTLPDGSRWVDAEALRLVCLHVAGQA